MPRPTRRQEAAGSRRLLLNLITQVAGEGAAKNGKKLSGICALLGILRAYFEQ